MTLAYWESLRALEQLSQSMQGVLATCLESYYQPTIWVGETETTYPNAEASKEAECGSTAEGSAQSSLPQSLSTYNS